MKRYKKEIIKSLFQEKPWYQSEKKSPTSSILAITGDISQYFPKSLKYPFLKIIDNLGLFIIRAFRILSISTQPYYLIQGKGVSNEKKIKILYHGNLMSINFLIKKIYGQKNHKKITRLPNSLKNKRQYEDFKDNFDLFITERDFFFTGFYQKKKCIVIPENISFLLLINKSVEEIVKDCSHSIQQDIHKAKSFGYTYEISSDINKFKMFYKTMYLPYVKWKYKEMEKIVSYDAIRHFALRGSKLLLLKHNNEYVFGGIFEIENHRITTQYAGLKQGQFHHLQNGIISLSYYYLIKIAQKYNVSTIDFGTSNPFLLDGLTTYKMKWKMNIVKTKPIFSTIFALKINPKSEKINEFFHENPFFYFNKKNLSAAFFIQSSHNLKTRKLEIMQRNPLKGIHPFFYTELSELLNNN